LLLKKRKSQKKKIRGPLASEVWSQGGKRRSKDEKEEK